MHGSQCGNGQTLVLLAAVVSFQLAQGRSVEDVELLAAFFEVLGDNLSLLAASAPQTCSTKPSNA